MLCLAVRSGTFSPYMQSTVHAVAGPLKALVPGVVVKGESVLVDTKKMFLSRESLRGQSPMTGPAVTVSINADSSTGSDCKASASKLIHWISGELLVFKLKSKAVSSLTFRAREVPSSTTN
uniref:Ubiquinol-cytochrome c reductase iron-sulphur subunit N-terminal domain-containing protein n=1 Tax=Nothobranchius furzeri TaxID=105023 RepID=A0A8C6MDT3_NOTFU